MSGLSYQKVTPLVHHLLPLFNNSFRPRPPRPLRIHLAAVEKHCGVQRYARVYGPPIRVAQLDVRILLLVHPGRRCVRAALTTTRTVVRAYDPRGRESICDLLKRGASKEELEKFEAQSRIERARKGKL